MLLYAGWLATLVSTGFVLAFNCVCVGNVISKSCQMKTVVSVGPLGAPITMLKIALSPAQFTEGLRTAIVFAAGLLAATALQSATESRSITCPLLNRIKSEPPRPACPVSPRWFEKGETHDMYDCATVRLLTSSGIGTCVTKRIGLAGFAEKPVLTTSSSAKATERNFIRGRAG